MSKERSELRGRNGREQSPSPLKCGDNVRLRRVTQSVSHGAQGKAICGYQLTQQRNQLHEFRNAVRAEPPLVWFEGQTYRPWVAIYLECPVSLACISATIPGELRLVTIGQFGNNERIQLLLRSSYVRRHTMQDMPSYFPGRN